MIWINEWRNNNDRKISVWMKEKNNEIYVKEIAGKMKNSNDMWKS